MTSKQTPNKQAADPMEPLQDAANLPGMGAPASPKIKTAGAMSSMKSPKPASPLQPSQSPRRQQPPRSPPRLSVPAEDAPLSAFGRGAPPSPTRMATRSSPGPPASTATQSPAVAALLSPGAPEPFGFGSPASVAANSTPNLTPLTTLPPVAVPGSTPIGAPATGGTPIAPVLSFSPALPSGTTPVSLHASTPFQLPPMPPPLDTLPQAASAPPSAMSAKAAALQAPLQISGTPQTGPSLAVLPLLSVVSPDVLSTALGEAVAAAPVPVVADVTTTVQLSPIITKPRGTPCRGTPAGDAMGQVNRAVAMSPRSLGTSCGTPTASAASPMAVDHTPGGTRTDTAATGSTHGVSGRQPKASGPANRSHSRSSPPPLASTPSGTSSGAVAAGPNAGGSARSTPHRRSASPTMRNTPMAEAVVDDLLASTVHGLFPVEDETQDTSAGFVLPGLPESSPTEPLGPNDAMTLTTALKTASADIPVTENQQVPGTAAMAANAGHVMVEDTVMDAAVTKPAGGSKPQGTPCSTTAAQATPASMAASPGRSLRVRSRSPLSRTSYRDDPPAASEVVVSISAQAGIAGASMTPGVTQPTPKATLPTLDVTAVVQPAEGGGTEVTPRDGPARVLVVGTPAASGAEVNTADGTGSEEFAALAAAAANITPRTTARQARALLGPQSTAGTSVVKRMLLSGAVRTPVGPGATEPSDTGMVDGLSAAQRNLQSGFVSPAVSPHKLATTTAGTPATASATTMPTSTTAVAAVESAVQVPPARNTPATTAMQSPAVLPLSPAMSPVALGNTHILPAANRVSPAPAAATDAEPPEEDAVVAMPVAQCAPLDLAGSVSAVDPAPSPRAPAPAALANELVAADSLGTDKAMPPECVEDKPMAGALQATSPQPSEPPASALAEVADADVLPAPASDAVPAIPDAQEPAATHSPVGGETEVVAQHNAADAEDVQDPAPAQPSPTPSKPGRTPRATPRTAKVVAPQMGKGEQATEAGAVAALVPEAAEAAAEAPAPEAEAQETQEAPASSPLKSTVSRATRRGTKAKTPAAPAGPSSAAPQTVSPTAAPVSEDATEAPVLTAKTAKSSRTRRATKTTSEPVAEAPDAPVAVQPDQEAALHAAKGRGSKRTRGAGTSNAISEAPEVGEQPQEETAPPAKRARGVSRAKASATADLSDASAAEEGGHAPAGTRRGARSRATVTDLAPVAEDSEALAPRGKKSSPAEQPTLSEATTATRGRKAAGGKKAAAGEEPLVGMTAAEVAAGETIALEAPRRARKASKSAATTVVKEAPALATQEPATLSNSTRGRGKVAMAGSKDHVGTQETGAARGSKARAAATAEQTAISDNEAEGNGRHKVSAKRSKGSKVEETEVPSAPAVRRGGRKSAAVDVPTEVPGQPQPTRRARSAAAVAVDAAAEQPEALPAAPPSSRRGRAASADYAVTTDVGRRAQAAAAAPGAPKAQEAQQRTAAGRKRKAEAEEAPAKRSMRSRRA